MLIKVLEMGILPWGARFWGTWSGASFLEPLTEGKDFVEQNFYELENGKKAL